jgi:arginase
MIRLFFPQWQGVGFETGMSMAAERLRRAVSENDPGSATGWINVPLQSERTLIFAGQVKGHDAILTQLTSANDLLRDAQTAKPSIRITSIGGDCGTEIIPVGWANHYANGDIALLWIDGHADLNTPQTSPSGNFHGMVLRTLLGDGDPQMVTQVARTLLPGQIAFVSVRELDPAESDYIAQHNIPIFHPQRDATQLQAVLDWVEASGFHNIYLHIDLDSLDAQEFPYTTYPSDGGLSITGAVHLIQAVRMHHNVVGFSLTEYASAEGHGLDVLEPLLAAFRQHLSSDD